MVRGTRTHRIHENKAHGFTLIELVVVMAIVAVLSILIVGAIFVARRTLNNTKKTNDMKTIMIALEAHRTKYKTYPIAVGTPLCGGWEVGNINNTSFLSRLANVGLTPTPTDSFTVPVGSCNGYKYYRYNAGSYGCSGGNFYVLGISNLEGGGVRPGVGPGWSCPTRNWGNEFDWVTGSFE